MNAKLLTYIYCKYTTLVEDQGFNYNYQPPKLHGKGLLFNLLTIAGLMFGGILLVSFLGSFILIPFYGMEGTKQLMENPNNIEGSLHPLRGFQMLYTIATFGLPALMFSYLKTKDKFGYFFSGNKPSFSLASMLPLIIISIYPLIAFLYHVNLQITFPEFLADLEDKLWQMEKDAELLIKTLIYDVSLSALLLNVLMIAVLPAFVEEWLFRGCIQNVIDEHIHRHHIAIWAAAFLFSAVHMQFFGFLPRLVLGALLGYIYFYTKNIWYPIIAHFFNNFLQLMGIFIIKRSGLEYDLDSTEPLPWLITVAVTVVFTGLFYLFIRFSKKVSLNYEQRMD